MPSGTVFIFDVASLIRPLTTTNPTRVGPSAGGSRRTGSVFIFDTASLIAPTSTLAKSRNPFTPGYAGVVVTGSIFAGGVIAPLARGATLLSFYPGAAYYATFNTQRLDTGAFTNADAAPILTIRRNGAIVSNFLTLTHPPAQAGEYVVSGTIPASFAQGDVINVSLQATVNGIAGKAPGESLLLGAPPITTGQIWP